MVKQRRHAASKGDTEKGASWEVREPVKVPQGGIKPALDICPDQRASASSHNCTRPLYIHCASHPLSTHRAGPKAILPSTPTPSSPSQRQTTAKLLGYHFPQSTPHPASRWILWECEADYSTPLPIVLRMSIYILTWPQGPTQSGLC